MYQLDDIFDLTPKGAQSLADEHLVKLCTVTVAVTINLPTKTPTFRKMKRAQKLDVLTALWALSLKQYRCLSDSKYYIEDTEQGEPHLHGKMVCQVPPEMTNPKYDKEFLRSIGKFILLQLPRSMYKQYATATSTNQLFQCPALCIKFVYSDQWDQYIKKNALKN